MVAVQNGIKIGCLAGRSPMMGLYVCVSVSEWLLLLLLCGTPMRPYAQSTEPFIRDFRGRAHYLCVSNMAIWTSEREGERARARAQTRRSTILPGHGEWLICVFAAKFTTAKITAKPHSIQQKFHRYS